MDYFLRHHRKFPLLLHPLTKFEVQDHTGSASWIGSAGSVPLDLDQLHQELPEEDICDTNWPQDIHPLVNGILNYNDWLRLEANKESEL